MVLKPSEKSPLACLLVGTIVNEAGLPPGVLSIVNGDAQTGALLASHMDIDKIAFTGSTATGTKIAQAAVSSNMKKVALELGGKSPSIVFPDANLEIAVQWCVQGITALSGQMCIASSRVYVHEDIKDVFIEGMKQAFTRVEAVIGRDPMDSATMIGPLVDKGQFERVSEYVRLGKSEAKLVAGGEPMHEGVGCWLQPTIFVEPDPAARIYREEIFGPVVVICSFRDEEDVIARANNSVFGLAGAVFSQDINRALRVADKIHAGTVCINCCSVVDYAVPVGGQKRSGWGRELGKVRPTFIGLAPRKLTVYRTVYLPILRQRRYSSSELPDFMPEKL